MMSPTKILISLILSACLAPTSHVAAQTTGENDAAVTNALTQRVATFFGHLKDPSVDAANAFADLLADGPLSDQPAKLEGFVDSYDKLQASYGGLLAAKPVNIKRLGEDLALLTYLYETERFPIVWRFAFYRPPLEPLESPDWFVVRLSFDTDLEHLANLP